jgi:hypothetical protein
MPLDEADLGEAGGLAQPLGLGPLSLRHIDAGNVVGRTNEGGGGEGAGSRAAAQIEDPLAGLPGGSKRDVKVGGSSPAGPTQVTLLSLRTRLSSPS